MSSIQSIRKLLLNSIMENPELIQLQTALLQKDLALEGDQELTQVFSGSVTSPGFNGSLGAVATPKDSSDQEWLIEGLFVSDTNSIDVLDRVGFYLADIVSQTLIPIESSTGSVVGQFTGQPGIWWYWPVNVALPAQSNKDIAIEKTLIRIFRKPSGESWRQINVYALTTATVGNRFFNLFCLYRRRPLTRL